MSTARTPLAAAARIWLVASNVRLSTRSATAPANGDARSAGIVTAAETRLKALADPVKSNAR
jgi:hypothetical protein